MQAWSTALAGVAYEGIIRQTLAPALPARQAFEDAKVLSRIGLVCTAIGFRQQICQRFHDLARPLPDRLLATGLLPQKERLSHRHRDRGAPQPFQVTVDIAVFRSGQGDRDDWRTRFQSQERRAIVTLLQPADNRLPALRGKSDHASLRQPLQRRADRLAVWLPAMDPDDAVKAEQRSDEPVIVQFDLSKSFDRRKRQECQERDHIRVTKMINDDQSGSAPREILQTCDCNAQKGKGQKARKPAQEEAGESPTKSQSRQGDQFGPPHFRDGFRGKGWLILHTHRDIPLAASPPDKT